MVESHKRSFNYRGRRVARNVQYLIDLNARHSLGFIQQKPARERYRQDHPTEIMFCKCMDGRLNASVWTNTPFGIFYPVRNLGGRFSLGSGFYLEARGWAEYAKSRHRKCLVAATYHFSSGERHRGCAGFDYDTAAASAFASGLKGQFDELFVPEYGKDSFYAVKIGFETDMESLVLHGSNGAVINLADITHPTENGLLAMLRDLYPDMHEQFVRDLLPLVQGNLEHVEGIRISRRSFDVEAEHGEYVLALGRGFDWLHEPNTALIINPFDFELVQVIERGARLLLTNIIAERIEGNVVLMSVAAYREDGIERKHAELKARDLNRLALKVIEGSMPELMYRLDQLTGTLDMGTRKLNVLDRKERKAA